MRNACLVSGVCSLESFQKMKVKSSSNGICESVIIAGFGGQGIVLAGKLLAQAAMRAGRK